MEENILLVIMDSCLDEIEVGANCMVKIAVREHAASQIWRQAAMVDFLMKVGEIKQSNQTN